MHRYLGHQHGTNAGESGKERARRETWITCNVQYKAGVTRIGIIQNDHRPERRQRKIPWFRKCCDWI